eukprot:scaffold92032_cov35-Phaeocystis_antarctica.AAC.1
MAGPTEEEGKALTGGDDEDDAQQGLDYLDSGAPGGSQPRSTPRKRPALWPPSNGLWCSSWPPPKPPISPPLTMQVLSHLEKKTGPLSQTLMHEQEQATPNPKP